MEEELFKKNLRKRKHSFRNSSNSTESKKQKIKNENKLKDFQESSSNSSSSSSTTPVPNQDLQSFSSAQSQDGGKQLVLPLPSNPSTTFQPPTEELVQLRKHLLLNLSNLSPMDEIVAKRTNEGIELELGRQFVEAQVFYFDALQRISCNLNCLNLSGFSPLLPPLDNSSFLRSRIEIIQKNLSLEQILLQMESFVEVFRSTLVSKPLSEDDKRWHSIIKALSTFDKMNNIALKMQVYGDIYSLFMNLNADKMGHFNTLLHLLEQLMQTESTNLKLETEKNLTNFNEQFELLGKGDHYLPLEMCETICSFLDFQSLYNLRQVNRRWRCVVSRSLNWHRSVIQTRLLLRYGERMLKKLVELKTCLRYAENFATSTSYTPSEMYLLLFIETFILAQRSAILNVGVGSVPICFRLLDFLRNFQHHVLQKEFTVSNFCTKMKAKLGISSTPHHLVESIESNSTHALDSFFDDQKSEKEEEFEQEDEEICAGQISEDNEKYFNFPV